MAFMTTSLRGRNAPQEGTIIRNCHSDATTFSREGDELLFAMAGASDRRGVSQPVLGFSPHRRM